ncbi:alpha-glucan family phosphorylase [bacterium]|nr:alpha-glucan family phosphorylase [bacterium]MBU1063244.1 alpha-glucan family phosphorylase [bacterium]MBU1633401.1 alpha-glucan family phosphorylase [bacterium]MBU1875312.1 alpha-glucan family phosphorylase [bacterium]
MKPIQKFIVSPVLPERLKRLHDLAHNLWWSWDFETRELFRRLDPDLWENVRHNPVQMLSQIDQEILEERARDESYLFQVNRVIERFNHTLKKTPWFGQSNKEETELSIAYFSMEYGITESLAVYSGGLGILSGDHVKSASDLGIPLCGVGLSYQNGYFQQRINIDDWQEEEVAANDFYNMPLDLVKDQEGNRLLIKVPYPGRYVYAQIWRAMVGRTPLYLLDSNIDENADADKKITAELYGGDMEIRIQQEILLGMGGVQALNAIDKPASVYHLNEGHSAFLGLERIRKHVSVNKLSFYEALELVKSSSIFTTHTPVQAGIDLFPASLIEKYFKDYCKDVGITINELLALGGKNTADPKEDFSMAILALKLSYKANAVSELHGVVARQMWRSLWPEILAPEIPIINVTNGIHQPSWTSREITDLYDRYLGMEWRTKPSGKEIWDNVFQIPDGELWRTHELRRQRLVEFVRRTLIKQYKNLGKPAYEIARVESVLNTEALTIGFARRFATYKRADLIFTDPERLEKLIGKKARPVQIIIAGKAHPQDNEGKRLIQQILKLSHEERFYQSVVFIENYDMNVARYLVQGCDLWLNTPRRGLEACGTSGMKAAVNGVINFSTLDGWWDEIYSPGIGWAIGNRETYEDNAYWDEQEAMKLYNILEKEIIPTFYYRDKDGLPRDWIHRMKNSIASICPVYNTNRMLSDYTNTMYFSAAERSQKMRMNSFTLSKELAQWKKHMRDNWKSIRFLKVETSSTKELSVKNSLELKTEIFLDSINPHDVELQIFYGKIDSIGGISEGSFVSMDLETEMGTNKFKYKGTLNNWQSGLNGFTIRIIPKHQDLGNPFEDGLIHWFEG